MKRIFAAAAFAHACASIALGFWVKLEEGHCHPIIDLDAGTGTWNVYVEHDVDGNWPADVTMLIVNDDPWPAGARVPRPPGSDWDFMGAPAHSNVWLLPQVEQPGLLWLGFANHSPPNTFSAYSESDPRVSTMPAKWISYHLRDVRFHGVGAGHVSCWTLDSFGNPIVWYSTADGGISAHDRFLLTEGGHVHVNWAFSHTGWYELDVQASGYLHGSMVFTNSPVATFYIGVGTTNNPRICALSSTPTQALINVTGTNLAYQLEYSLDGGRSWSPHGEARMGTGTNLWLDLPLFDTASKMRYRVLRR